MNRPVTIIERLSLVAPFGVRFWDEAIEAPVREGLVVTLAPATNPARQTQAFANNSGIYAATHVPGLRDAEFGAGDAAYWRNAPARRPFLVTVTDTARRFQPCSFAADLPQQGLFPWECGPLRSPPDAVRRVPLYSAPTRPVPPGMAALRADLWDPVAEAPAAWAVVEARGPGQLWSRGVADAQGRLALIFPYPEPVPGPLLSPIGSPLGGVGGALWEQEWEIEVQAFYTPQGPTPPIPDLCAVLGQAPTTLWADEEQTAPLTGATLRYGQELIVRSEGGSPRALLSILLITPAGSPP